MVRTSGRKAALFLLAFFCLGYSQSRTQTAESTPPSGLESRNFQLSMPSGSQPGFISELLEHLQTTTLLLNSFSDGKIFHSDFLHFENSLLVTTLVYGFDLRRRRFAISATMEWFSLR